uniref:Uncharacterized protein n=1 Tax=Yersinia enterocolitica TaxID=630 RepID=F2Q7X5_YEREN|nr:hypothetical protein Y69_0159 [Yersinia enterocolitica]
MIRTHLCTYVIAISANIRESECRLAAREICYPGLSSCITITLFNGDIMVGIHCTIANSAHEIRDAIKEIKEKIAIEFSDCYVIGALSVFKYSVFDRSISTRKKISNEINSHVTIHNRIKFHDTTMHLNTRKNVHVFISNSPIRVSYCAAEKCLVASQIPPLSVGRQYIPLYQFTKINNIGNMIICR